MGKQSHVVKDRICNCCGKTFSTTSEDLKQHFKTCVVVERLKLTVEAVEAA